MRRLVSRAALVALVVVTPGAAGGRRVAAAQAPTRVAVAPVDVQKGDGTPEVTDIVIGQSFSFESKVLAQPVRLDIALPPDYATSRDRYPVLLAFQNPATSVIGVVDAMSRAAAVPNMIVVAAAVPGDLFSLYPREGLEGSGRGPQVLEFLRSELEPLIDARYRTVPYRILLTHSASALFSLWALFADPEAIQAVLAAGPMFAEADFARVAGMIERALASRPARAQFLFFTQGNQPELAPGLAAFRDLLTARRPPGLTWEFDPEPMANHNSLGIRTLYDGLWKLYADWSSLPETVAAGGGVAIRAHRKTLADRFGYDIGLSRLADSFVRATWTAQGRHDAVIALTQFGCDESPSDYWPRIRLALACVEAGRWKDAVAAWEAAVVVARANAPAQELQRIMPMLERRLAEARRRTTRTWSRMESGTTQGLVGVWGTSGRDVFAVGGQGTVLHFDGRAWSRTPVEGEPHLIAVWGASDRDVFAVGDEGVILHYDGRAWTAMESGTTMNLIGVWGASGRDVFVVGYGGTLLHYDGSTWTPMAAGATGDLNGVWGSGPEDVFVVGGAGTILHYGGGAAKD